MKFYLEKERKKETWAFLVLMKVKKGKQQRNVRMNKGTFASQREWEKKLNIERQKSQIWLAKKMKDMGGLSETSMAWMS